MIFAERLQDARKSRNISQSTLAKNISVTQGMISQWEKGICEPTATNIANIAIYLGVSSDYLLGLEDDCGNKKIFNITNNINNHF